MEFNIAYAELKQKVEAELAKFFDAESATNPNKESIRVIRDFCLADGKRLRPIIIVAGHEACGGKREDILPASIGIEILHGYFLIHDDVMDEDPVRRGKPTVHATHTSKFGSQRAGENLAILYGDIACALAKKPILQSGFSPERKCAALEEMVDLEVKTGYGQYLDELSKLIKIENYVDYVLEIHKYKTAWYTLAGPLRLGAILASATNSQIQALTDFGLNVGLAFQIQDDLMGTLNPEALKKAKNDITEGKLTMPLACLYEQGTSEQIAAVNNYRGKPLNEDDCTKVKAVLEESGALSRCREMAEHYVGIADRILADIDVRNKEFLSGLANFVIKRNR